MKEHIVDRTGWGEGPWDGEPDRVEFEHRGLPCLIVRAETTGALCGYVAVPPGHPAHGKNLEELRVHGGITYAGLCRSHICHVPRPGEPDDVWWLGFDCAHGWDVMPAMNKILREAGVTRSLEDPYEVYRDLSYVTDQVRQLADQLAAMEVPR